jgi:hypothetical protein
LSVWRAPPCAGLHLIKHAAWRTLERGGQFVLLGSAPDPKARHHSTSHTKSLQAKCYPGFIPLSPTSSTCCRSLPRSCMLLPQSCFPAPQ